MHLHHSVITSVCWCGSDAECQNTSVMDLVMDYNGVFIPLLYLCVDEFDLSHHGPRCKLINMYVKGFLCYFLYAWCCFTRMLKMAYLTWLKMCFFY